LAGEVALALTSDLFDVLLPYFVGQKSDFLGEASSASRDKTAKLIKSSEITVQRHSLRDATPKQSASPNFLEEQVVFSYLRQFKMTAQMRGLLQILMESIMPDG
jgi:hypothetical protein